MLLTLPTYKISLLIAALNLSDHWVSNFASPLTYCLLHPTLLQASGVSRKEPPSTTYHLAVISSATNRLLCCSGRCCCHHLRKRSTCTPRKPHPSPDRTTLLGVQTVGSVLCYRITLPPLQARGPGPRKAASTSEESSGQTLLTRFGGEQPRRIESPRLPRAFLVSREPLTGFRSCECASPDSLEAQHSESSLRALEVLCLQHRFTQRPQSTLQHW